MKLVNQFQPVRDWAEERGLYDNGDIKTQCCKLQEEVGELSRATLRLDTEEAADAIGDCAIVLVNLAELWGLSFEVCVNQAFQVVKDRQGKMENGTFVKR